MGTRELRFGRLAGLAWMVASTAAPAAATTIVALSDAQLVDRAEVVARVWVESELDSVGERPQTDWMLGIDKVLKGRVDAGRIVVRVPGGVAPSGLRLHIFGTPRFGPGQEALVFLRQRADGTWALSDFPQGAFLAAETSRRRLALRDLSEVRVLGGAGRSWREPFRDLDRFSDWIADRAEGDYRARDYLVSPRPSELSTITSPFSFFEKDGVRMRWFTFDSGGTVVYRMNGAAPNQTGGGAAELQRALAAWTNEATTPVRLAYGGTTSASAGHTRSDRQNVIHWNDPNDELSTFSCSSGGTLAIGGPWYEENSATNFNGIPYLRIGEGDVVFADGFGCMKSSSPDYSKFLEEVVAHEVGHTLGIRHSSENRNEPNATLKQALMWAYAHNDARGARLNSDDVKALQTLYRVGGVPSGGGGGTPPPASGCGADKLCLLNGRVEVTLQWTNQFDGSSGGGRAIAFSNFAGFFHFSPDPRNLELIVKVVDYGGRILVFYSELTKINFRMRVTDRLTGQVKEYTNTNRNCGGIDTDFLAGATSLISGGPPTEIRDLGLTQPAGGTCVPGPGRLCLLNRRFAVTLPSWTNQHDGSTGAGNALPMNDLTGGFHFSADPRNLEVLFKVNQFPDRILVFFASLTEVDFRVHLTDTSTGRTTEFHNPTGSYCGGFVGNLLAGPPF